MKLKLIVSLLIFLVTVSSVLSISISPPEITAENLIRGSHYEKEIFLGGINAGDDVIIEFHGEANNWLDVDHGTSFIYPGDTTSLPLVFSIDVPSDAANGEYEASATITSTKPSSLSIDGLDKVTSSVIAGVALNFVIEVTGKQVKDYEVTHINIPDTEENSPIYISVKIENNGNVIATPSKLKISTIDKFRIETLFTETVTELTGVEPHSTEEIIVSVNHDLSKEQYWANITIYDEEDVIFDDQVDFEILEEDSLRKSGTLNELQATEEVNSGETVKITALFENNGELPVSAKFVGEIYHEDSLLEAIESDVSSVVPSESDDLIIYYSPEEAGDYTIEGYVVYADKKTDSKGADFLVNGKGNRSVMKNDMLLKVMFGAVIILLIGLIIIIYITKKRGGGKVTSK